MEFYVPNAWKNNANMMYIINNKSLSEREVYNKLSEEGYTIESKIIYDYISYMIQDILDSKHNESYVTANTIKYNEKLHKLFLEETPCIVIKTNFLRKKLCILDIIHINDKNIYNEKYIDNYDEILYKKYKKLSYFSSYHTLEYIDFNLNLIDNNTFPPEDSDYIINNLKILKYNYIKWSTEREHEYTGPVPPQVELKEFSKRTKEQDEKNKLFVKALEDYYDVIINKKGL
jgi:hypothetical protein